MFQGPLPQPSPPQLFAAQTANTGVAPPATMAQIDYNDLIARAHYLRSRMVRDAIGGLWHRLTHHTAAPAGANR